MIYKARRTQSAGLYLFLLSLRPAVRFYNFILNRLHLLHEETASGSEKGTLGIGLGRRRDEAQGYLGFARYTSAFDAAGIHAEDAGADV